jgi:carbon-monoxide dehydrogenase medium subunit
LNHIREEGGTLRIGATTTHYQVESSPLVRSKCPLLAEAAASIGDIQVRNQGTMGGSVAHADPAADYPASLLALEGRVILLSANSEREISLADFFVDTFTTALEPGEIVYEVIVPVEEQSTGTSYQKVIQPASGFAIVGIAARVQKSNGKIGMARIGVTGLSGKPYRAANVEKALEGTAATAADIQNAALLVADGVDASADLHASANYRKQLGRVYTARALATALSRMA